MNLNKKIIALALASTVSASALATVATYTATVTGLAEPTLVNTTPIHFGEMNLAVGSICTMDDAGAVTGQCAAAGTGLSIGLVTISTLTAGTNLSINVGVGVGANVTYTAVYDINAAAAPVAAAPAGTPQSVTVAAGGADITLDLYGSMEVTTVLDASTDATAAYDVTVIFE